MDVWNQSEKTEIRADMSKLNFILNDTLMGEQLYNSRKLYAQGEKIVLVQFKMS